MIYYHTIGLGSPFNNLAGVNMSVLEARWENGVRGMPQSITFLILYHSVVALAITLFLHFSEEHCPLRIDTL